MWSGQGTDIRPHSFNIFFQRSLEMLSILSSWEMQVLPSTSACKLCPHHLYQSQIQGKSEECDVTSDIIYVTCPTCTQIANPGVGWRALGRSYWGVQVPASLLACAQPSTGWFPSHFSPHYSRITSAKGSGPPNPSLSTVLPWVLITSLLPQRFYLFSDLNWIFISNCRWGWAPLFSNGI